MQIIRIKLKTFFSDEEPEDEEEKKKLEEEQKALRAELQEQAKEKQKKRNDKFGELLRSKGFFWIATSNDVIGAWQQAGNVLRSVFHSEEKLRVLLCEHKIRILFAHLI